MHRRLPSLSAGLLAFVAGLPLVTAAQADSDAALWDTGAPLAIAPREVNTTQWRPVPAEIFSLEKDPLKAASDPGYYGREYSFGGDAVVINQNVAAVFQSQLGRVSLFARDVTDAAASDHDPDGFGRKIADLVPLALGSPTPIIRDVRVVRNFADEVALEVTFSGKATGAAAALFVFDRTGIVEVRPGDGMKGFSVLSPLDHAVVPGFIGDDLVYSAGRYPTAEALAVPAENALVGLLDGEDAELVMTWPAGQQEVNLRLTGDGGEARRFQAIDFTSAGRSFYLATLRAPGIWHQEKLGAAYLEKDVVSEWKRPFPAKWQTQLLEAKVRTTYGFRDVKGEIWRGVPGSYTYPVWFDGEDAHFQLSKKIPPKGEALVYFLEAQGTPASVSTPADIVKATLGRPVAAAILDVEGRKLRTHHRRTDALTHRACTCGYTEAIQALFEQKVEVAKKDEVAGSLDDMIYFVQSHVDRINEYRRFADEMSAYLKNQATAHGDLKPYLDDLEQIVQQIPGEYEVQKENMKSMAYAADLARQTMALTGHQDAGNLAAYMELLKSWRAMGGAQDYVVARCHMIARQLAQEAGYGSAELPAAVASAVEIRSRCKQILRNADGYEIWSNY